MDDGDEDVGDENVTGDEGGRSHGDEPWWPHPVVAAPTPRETAAQPATATRASSMGIPFRVNLRPSADIQQFDRGA
jgi:hypothetical protein